MSHVDYFVHDKGICESASIGKGTRIWAFSHILPCARVGENCNICDNVFIENEVKIGDNVTVKSGVQLWDGIQIGNNVFIGPNATFSNDPYPRSKKFLKQYPVTRIDDNASIGANATILPGIRIGENCMIGAGAVVTKDVPANAIVVGNPAKIISYDTKFGSNDDRDSLTYSIGEDSGVKDNVVSLGVGKCSLWSVPYFEDMRGSLSVFEFKENLPFVPLRSFFVYGVSSDSVRGEHAHRNCKQFLVVVSGSVSIVIDDGHHRREVLLDSPLKGLYLHPMTWGIQYKFTKDAVLSVYASDPYDSDDYIRDYSQFLEEVKERGD